MPNGGDVPGGTGIIPLITSTISSFLGFGGGKSAGEAAFEIQVISDITDRIITRLANSQPITAADSAHLGLSFTSQAGVDAAVASKRNQLFGPLVTERFQDLPPFQPAPDLPVLQELGIPFMDEPVQGEFPTLPGPRIPEPDVRREEMALDVPLLAGFGPLVRQAGQAISPTIGAIAGGFLQDVFFNRAPQELGAAQVPMRRAPSMPGEKPSTRILRRIFENTGVRIKLSAAKALTRQLGLQAAANCLRVSVMDLCTLIITPSPRRRRGISGSDIRIVKRTARRFQSLQEDLSGLVSRRRAAPRRRRHVHAIQHTAPAN